MKGEPYGYAVIVSASALSFVMPAYNAEKTITSSILSAQRVAPGEVIVVDDGSQDETARVARSLGARVVSQANAGPAEARKRGVELASGEFIVLLDADDEVVAAGISRSLEMLERAPEAAAVVAQTMTTPKHGAPYRMPVWPEGITADSLVRRGHAPAPPAAIVFRGANLKRALSDNPRGVWPRLAEDYELLLRVALTGPVLYNPDVAATYVWGAGRSSAGIAQEIRDAQSIRRHYAAMAGVPESELPKQSRRGDTASIALRRAGEASGRWYDPRRLGWTAVAAMLHPERFVEALVRRIRKKDGSTHAG
ncbi:glycosyltransferase family 2 protein [Nigerium massiliense]|uniref:glycosyltransferase family 2 protein n=1 Tax=Nigerium massiliense TaxID=1522317 RepID=UPI000693FFA3|nr:glycosyltransferase family 2 protein [Nigerium massiliense]